MNRYSAKLLFRWRVVGGGSSCRRRLCEERIIIITANSAAQALAKAKRTGRAGQWDSRHGYGSRTAFEFIGVMELLKLDPVCEEDEVWFEIKERLLPMERADRFIPPEHFLEAIRNEPKRGRGRQITKGN